MALVSTGMWLVPSGVSCTRMGAAEDLVEVASRHLRVDLSGAQTSMTEQLLDGPEVRATLEQMGGERVPEHVRREPAAEPGPLRGDAHDLPSALARQAPAPAVDEQRRLGATAGRGGRHEVRPAPPGVLLDRVAGHPSDGHDPLLRALALDPQ